MHVTAPLRTVGLLARQAGLAVLERSLLGNPIIELVAVATHRLLPASEDPARGERPEFRSFAEICSAHGIALLAIDERAAARDLDPLEPFAPIDLLCSVSWRHVLSARALARARVAALNLHRGKLPEYAGAEPVRRMIEDGATRAVITAHLMVEEVDAGDVVATAELRIGESRGRSSRELAEAVKAELVQLYPVLMDQAIRAVAARVAAQSA